MVSRQFKIQCLMRKVCERCIFAIYFVLDLLESIDKISPMGHNFGSGLGGSLAQQHRSSYFSTGISKLNVTLT